MKALVFDGRLSLADVPLPRRDGEALIQVRLAGICNTDIEITRGYGGYRGVLGHEFVGDVVECPDTAWTGRRVCGEINAWCGHCVWCRAGMPTHCTDRTVLGIVDRAGAFAEYLSLPVRNLHAVPEEVDDEEAVFVEPLAAAFEILEQVPVNSTDRVVVLGDGKLGMLCVQALRSAGARVVLVGKHANKLSRARALGLETRTLQERVPEPADVVVEASGSASGLQMAISLVRPRGTIVLKSTVAQPTGIDMSPVVVNEVTVVGSRCGPFDRAIAALQRMEVAVRPLVDARFPLDRAIEAMERAASPGTMKVLLEPHP
jgi:alcohol dehydrogenase